MKFGHNVMKSLQQRDINSIENGIGIWLPVSYFEDLPVCRLSSKHFLILTKFMKICFHFKRRPFL